MMYIWHSFNQMEYILAFSSRARCSFVAIKLQDRELFKSFRFRYIQITAYTIESKRDSLSNPKLKSQDIENLIDTLEDDTISAIPREGSCCQKDI